MSKGGLIIRLIDVVLILLLGFISISDFTVKAQVKLPQSREQGKSVSQKNNIIKVKVKKSGEFEVDEGKKRIYLIPDIRKVDQVIAAFKNKYPNLIVIIEPDMDTIIQKTVDLLDICEKYQIPKSINYEL